MKHGLIFDLDGTLVDSLEGIAASLNRALSASGLPVHPLAAVRGFIGNGARILVQRAAPADSAGPLLDTLEQAFKTDYEVTWQSGTAAYDGIAGLLTTLQERGYPLAVLSNKPHPFTLAIVANVFPTIHFQVVLGQLAGIPHKPDPAGALEIANLLSLLPDECTIIGDSTMDIETARHAGMGAVAVSWGFHDRQRLAAADVIVDDTAALAALFA
ncbi:HAD-IA family hydrolase [bacterium]|nr:HAD-IA family hydrolase [bacterium]